MTGRSIDIMEQRELTYQPEPSPWFEEGQQPESYIDRDPHFWNSIPEKGNKAVDYTFDIYSWNLVYKGVVQKGIKQRRSLHFVNAHNLPLYRYRLPPVPAFN